MDAACCENVSPSIRSSDHHPMFWKLRGSSRSYLFLIDSWQTRHLQCAFTLLTYCGCWFPWLCIHLKSVISGHFCLQNLWWFASPLDKKLICVNRSNFVHGIHLRYITPLYMVSFISRTRESESAAKSPCRELDDFNVFAQHWMYWYKGPSMHRRGINCSSHHTLFTIWKQCLWYENGSGCDNISIGSWLWRRN